MVQVPEFLSTSLLHTDIKIFFKRNAILSLRIIMLINEVKNQLRVLIFKYDMKVKLLLVHQTLKASIEVFQTHYLILDSTKMLLRMNSSILTCYFFQCQL